MIVSPCGSGGFTGDPMLMLVAMADTHAQTPTPVLTDFRAGGRLQVGVLTNPRSGGNKKGVGEIRSLLAGWTDVLHREAFTPEDMTEALVDFARNGVDLLVVNGGDGTVHAVLTAIGRDTIFEKPPLLALLCAGTTSMLARDVGTPGSAVAALPRILAWAEAADANLTILPRPVLRVSGAAHQPPLFGMFFGAGAICQGIKIFHRGVNPMGWRGELMPGLTLLRMLLAILFRDRDKVPPILTRSCLDDRPPEKRENLFVLISTLERLFLGLQPYWGTEDGPLRYTAVGTEPKRLLQILPSLFRRRKSRQLSRANGYFSHNARVVQLEMEGDFTLDGELYEAGQGPISVEATEPVMFLRIR